MTEDSNGSSSLVSSSVYCYCNHGLCCNRCGKPMKNRNDTKTVIESLYTSKRPARSNVFGNGPLLLSDVPESSKGKGNRVVLGIDEAGRGSVLGPMVYGMAYWSSAVEDKIPKSFNDSKQLTEEKRSQLFDEILAHEHIGFALRSLLPSEISRNMLRSTPYNLNEMSHDTAMILIRKLLNANVNVAKCYIDTVGNPAYYKRKLEREFPGLEFVVESKADANYAPCSAASVVAKVMRDRMAEGWQFSEPALELTTDFGSGYPSDPKCKAWMDELQDPLFGYSDILRFSWAPTKAKLEEKGIPVVFKADLDDDDDGELLSQQKGMSAFLGKNKRKRLAYFEKRNLKAVNVFQ